MYRFFNLVLIVAMVIILMAGCNNQYMSSGIIYMQQNDFDKAIIQFNEAIKLEPNNPQAYLWMGKAYGSKSDFDKASEYFIIALEKDTTGQVLKEMKENVEFYWPVLFNAGTGFLRNKDSKENKSKYEKYLLKAEDVKDTSINYDYLVLLYAETGDESNMTKTIEKSISKNPKNLSLFFNVAKYYIGIEKFDEAKKYLDKAKAIDSENPQIIYWLGEIAYSSKNFDEAIKNFNSFNKIYESSDSTMKSKLSTYRNDVSFKLGKIYLEEKKNYKEAIVNFVNALKVKDDDFESMLNLGFAYYKNKDYADAVKTIDDYITKTGTEISDLYLIKADCYSRMKMNDKSQEAYKKYEDLKKQGK
ncbi:MAG: tetratricopeptide repeat protein [candidate division WOR-3 bacterium]